VAAWSLYAAWPAAAREWDTHTVRYERLTRPIVARGDLQAAESSDIICQVKNRTQGSIYASTIRWIIDDGSLVQRGQLLVELDDSALEEELQVRQLLLEQARDAWMQAEENAKIVASQNQSDLKTAEVAVELAALDVRKYLEGDYEQQRKDLAGRLSMAESDLEMWRDRVAYSERLARRGFVQESQVRTDRSRRDRARLALEKLEEEARVLEEYTHRRALAELEGKRHEAERALARVREQTRAAAAQAEINRLARYRIAQRRLVRCRDIEADIRKCLITAPHDGLVLYAGPRDGFRSERPIVAQGEPVREGQLLMRLPNLNRIQVVVRVHEALVARVRGEVWQATGFGDALESALLLAPDTPSRLLGLAALAELRPRFRAHERRQVYGGDEARVRTEAHPDRVWHGHVQRVAPHAALQDWSSADVPVYDVQVTVDDPVDGLRPGMSAAVEIHGADQAEPVLAVPVQALFGSPALGRQRKCWVQTPAGPEERHVVVGSHTEEMAAIDSGLQEGDEVILNPQELLAADGP
jgi:multidrug efflux pump subunit AcrA (membrane-fusion protein)